MNEQPEEKDFLLEHGWKEGEPPLHPPYRYTYIRGGFKFVLFSPMVGLWSLTTYDNRGPMMGGYQWLTETSLRDFVAVVEGSSRETQ